MNIRFKNKIRETLCKRGMHLQSVLFLAIPLSCFVPRNDISAQISNQAQAIRISEAESHLQEKYMAAVVQQQSGKSEGAAKLYAEVLNKNPKCDGCAFQLSKLYSEVHVQQYT